LGFSPNQSYWLLHGFGKTPNISHATTTGLESAGKKRLNPTVREIIENIRSKYQKEAEKKGIYLRLLRQGTALLLELHMQFSDLQWLHGGKSVGLHL